MNHQGEFRSYNNQIDTNCMHLVSIWSNVLQRDIPTRKNLRLEINIILFDIIDKFKTLPKILGEEIKSTEEAGPFITHLHVKIS